MQQFIGKHQDQIAGVLSGGRPRGLARHSTLAALERLVPIDPDHLPQALGAIRSVGSAFPDTPQVACFDTAFHRYMPRVAQLYALPRALADAGVIRLGFHGISYEYIVQELRVVDPGAVEGRVIIAHLGNGANMAAVRGGIGTTMGFSPTGGLIMSTRSGDLDQGVQLYLYLTFRSRNVSAGALSALVNQEAGWESGVSADMRDLLSMELVDPRAGEAVEVFCYQARKFLGALAAVLGGVDTLMFTAGIGEHSAQVRERICAGLGHLGLEIDPQHNAAHAPIISREGGRAVIRVMKTDEDPMIARHTDRLISASGASRLRV